MMICTQTLRQIQRVIWEDSLELNGEMVRNVQRVQGVTFSFVKDSVGR